LKGRSTVAKLLQILDDWRGKLKSGGAVAQCDTYRVRQRIR